MNVPWREWWLALRALLCLGERRFGAVESVLLRLCRHPDFGTRYFAQYALCCRKEYADLRHELAREGEFAANEALSYWPDSEATEICRDAEIKWAEAPYPKSFSPWMARITRYRLDLLSSGKWEETFKNEILGDTLAPWAEDYFDWALWIARQRRVPWLQSVLRKRLARSMEEGRVSIEVPPPLDDQPSWIVDEALVALAETGASLEDRELRYLRYFGYACEPRKRLAEIFEEKAYPR